MKLKEKNTMYFKTVSSFYLREKHCKNCIDQEEKNTPFTFSYTFLATYAQARKKS